MSDSERHAGLGLATPHTNMVRLAYHETLSRKPVRILYSDPYILVIDKPSGIPSSGHHSALEVVQRITGSNDVFPQHRLDTDTTGVLVFGKSRTVRANISAQFADRQVKKEYIALIEGSLQNTRGIIAPLLKGAVTSTVSMEDGTRTAATAFRQIGTFQDLNGRDYSLLSVRLFTGRTHQIRAHLEHLGHPIAGDRQYNPNDASDFRRQMLHASRLTLTHPVSGIPMTFHAPYPADFPLAIQPV
jgi:23S rRNA pseudouridine1911/1915/1917 synthase